MSRRERIAVVAATAMLDAAGDDLQRGGGASTAGAAGGAGAQGRRPRKVHAETKELRMIRMIVNDDDTLEPL